MRRDWTIAVVTTAVLTTGAVGLGYYAGSRDATPAPITIEVPEWAEPSAEKERNAYEDERTQDPSGVPYCDVTDSQYPCIDLDVMGYLDLWGDEALVIADHYKGDDWQGVGLFNCDPMAQDCRLMEPSEYPEAYGSTPNVYVISD